MKNKPDRFVIFGQGRSGSNLLVDLINSSPQVICKKELLNRAVNRKRFHALKQLYIRNFPYHYILWQYKKHTANIFGFKLMTHQLISNQHIAPKIFDGSWKIIYLHRHNILLKCISNMIARQSSEYIRVDGEPGDAEIYTIDPKKLIRQMQRRIEQNRLEEKLLAGTDHIRIVYETDLFDETQWPQTTARIFNFLNVENSKPKVKVRKTSEKLYCERISNYDEIVGLIKKTEFSDMLQDFK